MVRLPDDRCDDGTRVDAYSHRKRRHDAAVVAEGVRLANPGENAQHRERGVDHRGGVLLRLAAVRAAADAIVCIADDLNLRGGQKQTKGKRRGGRGEREREREKWTTSVSARRTTVIVRSD